MGIRQMWAGLRCQHDGTIGWVELCGKVGAHAGNWNPNGCQLYAVNLEVVGGWGKGTVAGGADGAG